MSEHVSTHDISKKYFGWKRGVKFTYVFDPKIRAKDKIFLYSMALKIALGSINILPRGYCALEAIRACEADYTLPFRDEIKNKWSLFVLPHTP